MRPGDHLENPVTGERFTFVATAESTGGELLAFDLGLRPGGAVPMAHVHPEQTERFTVVAGRMRFRVGPNTELAGPGEVVEVPPGVIDAFRNDGEEEALVRVEVVPALRMEEMFGEVVALAHAGGLSRFGMPRDPRVLARLACDYAREAHAPFLTTRTQRALLRPLARLGAKRAVRECGEPARGRRGVTTPA